MGRPMLAVLSPLSLNRGLHYTGARVPVQISQHSPVFADRLRMIRMFILSLFRFWREEFQRTLGQVANHPGENDSVDGI
jgi:hypothetical protein